MSAPPSSWRGQRPLTPSSSKGSRTATIEARLEQWSRETATGCRIWLGTKTADGYGKISVGGRPDMAHRVAYRSARGAIPEGLEIDHLCRNRDCVNPAHMETVTHAENMRRSAFAKRSHCVNGHPFDAANTYFRGPTMQSRACRACNRASKQRRKASLASVGRGLK